jgi:sugar porter (SP) family MFS transporter
MSSFYLILTAFVSAIGGLLFGYDIGVINGVLEMGPFKDTFKWENSTQEGFIVSSLQLGCFIGSIFSSILCDRLGRRRSILVGAVVFCVGGAAQTFASTLPPLYAGRLIAGLAIGLLSMAVPLYLSEIAPKEIRGRLVSMQQLAITVGILVAFLINWGTSSIASDNSWRVPFGLQVAFSVLMAIGMLFLPSSPRWLVSHNYVQLGERALAKLRGGQSNDVKEEFDEIQENIRLEREIGDGSWSELFSNGMWKRLAIGVALQMFQQLTGINAVMYYAPRILKASGFSATDITLLAVAGTGVVNVVMTFPGIFLVDRLGRRPLLISGALIMAAAMSALGAMIAIFGPDYVNHAVPWACLVMVYVFVSAFAYSWGPIGWIYPSEIYPLRIRAKATSITTSSNWLFNFIIAQVFPALLNSIQWGVLLLFAGFSISMAGWVWLSVPETKGKSLEEIDKLFGQEGVTHAGEAALKKTMAAGGH